MTISTARTGATAASRLAALLAVLLMTLGVAMPTASATESSADDGTDQEVAALPTEPSEEGSSEEESSEEEPSEQQQSEEQTGEQQSQEPSGEQQSEEQQSEEEQSGEEQSGEEQSGEEQSGEEQSGEEQSGEQQQPSEQPEEQQPEDEQSPDEIEQVAAEPSCVAYPTHQLHRVMARYSGAATSVVGGEAVVGGIPTDACPFQVNFSSYDLPGGFMEPWTEQVLVDNVSAMFAGEDVRTDGQLGNGARLTVDVPECGWQTDLYLGDNVLGDEPLDVEWPAPHSPINPAVTTKILLDWDVEQVDPSTCVDDEPPTASVVVSGCVDTPAITATVDTSNDGAVTATLIVTGELTDGTPFEDTVEVEAPANTATTTLQVTDLADGDYSYRVLLDDEEVTSGTTTVACQIDVEVDKTNDADGDGTFGDDETADAPGADVDFLLRVTNAGSVPGTVRMVDAFDGTQLVLFGDDAEVTTTCTLGGEPFTAADELAPGDTIDCLVTLVGYAPDLDGRIDNVVTATLTTELGDTTDEDDSTVRTRGGNPDVAIDKTNDADQDGSYSDDEVAPAPGEDVSFRLLVTNTGEVAGPILLRDALADGSELLLLGPSVVGTPDVATSCVRVGGAADGTSFGGEDVLAPGDAVRCLFTLTDYSPPALEQLVNVAEVELLEPERDDSGAITDVTPIVTDEDDSVVRSLEVLGETVENEDEEQEQTDTTPDRDEPEQTRVLGATTEASSPEALARTGASTGDVFVGGLGLLLVGAAMVARGRRDPQGG